MSYQQNKMLLSKFQLGDLELNNRIVMSSLTRGRANNGELKPTDLHVAYYEQRASAGLIITESVWVSQLAIGFINIPGIYTDMQTEAWNKVTSAVHKKGGKIFIQLVHSGSVSHPDFYNGELPFGPSAVNPGEKSFTPEGFKDTLTPREYSLTGIQDTINEFTIAAINAKKAGFDGIEIHAQLFTLIPQFLSATTNKRTDSYGGSIENRARILFDIIDAIGTIYPANRIGIKFTPAVFNSGVIKPDSSTIETYNYIFNKLTDYNIAYVHIVKPNYDISDTVLSPWNENFFSHFRAAYKGVLMLNAGFEWDSANMALETNEGDLISFGKHFIANPDLVSRFERQLTLAEPDTATFYTGGASGYTDYPIAKAQ